MIPVAPTGPPLLVVITGSRRWSHAKSIHRDLRVIEQTGRLWAIIEGDAHGADRIAGRGWAAAARRRGIGWISLPADWERYGTAAGPIRNHEMLVYALQAAEIGITPVVLAYPTSDSKGTRHMMQIAEDAGVRVIDRSR